MKVSGIPGSKHVHFFLATLSDWQCRSIVFDNHLDFKNSDGPKRFPFAPVALRPSRNFRIEIFIAIHFIAIQLIVSDFFACRPVARPTSLLGRC